MTAWQNTIANRRAGARRLLSAAVLLTLFVVACLPALGAGPNDTKSYAGSAPANSQISNTATASFTVAGSSTPVTSPSATTYVTVGQIDSLILDTNDQFSGVVAESGLSGASFSQSYTITNYSNATITNAFKITLTNTNAPIGSIGLYSDASCSPSKLLGTALTTSSTSAYYTIPTALAPNATFNFYVCGTYSTTATAGTSGAASIVVEDTNTTNGNVLKAYVPGDARLTSTINVSVTSNATVNVVKNFVANNGDASASAITKTTATGSWVHMSYANNGLKPSGLVVISDDLSTTNANGDGGLTLDATPVIYINSSSNSFAASTSGSNVTVYTDAKKTSTATTTSGTSKAITVGGLSSYNASVYVSGSKVYVNFDSLPVGVSGDIWFHVNFPSTPTYSSGTANYTNTAIANYNDLNNASATYQTPTVSPATITLTQVYGVAMQTALVNSMAFVPANLAATASATGLTSANYVDYVVALQNTSNGPDTYTLQLPVANINLPSLNGTASTASLYSVTNAAGALSNLTPLASSTVAVGANSTNYYLVRIQLPNGLNDTTGSYYVKPYAVSISDSSKSATVTDNLSNIKIAVDLLSFKSDGSSSTTASEYYGNGAPAATADATNPGNAYNFTLKVINNESQAEVYSVAASKTKGGSDLDTSRYSVVYYASTGSDCAAGHISATPVTTFSVPANSTAYYCAAVTALTSDTPGTDNVYFQVNSTVAPVPVSDYLYDQMIVAAYVNFTVSQENKTVVSGGTAVYTETIKNTGNVEAIPTLASWSDVVSSGATFSYKVAVSDGSGGYTNLTPGTALPAVAVGASNTYYLLVTAAVGDPLGATDTVTVVVTGAGTGANSTVTSSTTAKYVTTVSSLATSLSVTKLQALDANCSSSASSLSFSSAQFTALPGQCIAYQITATNGTGSEVDALTLSDSLSAYVTLNTTNANLLPAWTGGTTAADYAASNITGVYANTKDGNSGVYTLTSPVIKVLPVGDSVVFTFEVKIN